MNKNKEKERRVFEDREKCDNNGLGQVHSNIVHLHWKQAPGQGWCVGSISCHSILYTAVTRTMLVLCFSLLLFVLPFTLN